MAWRDTKAAARNVTHQTFKVRCAYIAEWPLDSNSQSNSGAVTYPEFDVRIHEQHSLLGDQAGTSLNSAQRYEADPVILFWRADLIAAGITIERNAVISVTEGEAYEVELAEPHDQETIKVRVVRMTSANAAGLPLPVG